MYPPKTKVDVGVPPDPPEYALLSGKLAIDAHAAPVMTVTDLLYSSVKD